MLKDNLRVEILQLRRVMSFVSIMEKANTYNKIIEWSVPLNTKFRVTMQDKNKANQS